MSRLFPLSALILVAGCASAGRSGGSDAVGTFTDATSDTDAGPIDSGYGTSTPPPPADADWYAIDAHLSLLAGEIVLGPPTSLQVTLLDAALELVCVHDIEIEAATLATPPPGEPDEVGWWELALLDGVPDRADCPAFGARALRLGVGPYDPRLDPALADQQTPGDPTPYDDALYGLYLQEADGGPLYVVGVVTMPGLLQRDLVSTPPLADGTYEAHSLLLLSFVDG
jgi:hypothetical protein